QADIDGQDMVRLEAWFNLEYVEETLDDETGRTEAGDRQRRLQDDHQAASGTIAATDRARPCGELQAFNEICARCPPRGEQPDHESRRGGDHDSEEDRPLIDRHFV